MKTDHLQNMASAKVSGHLEERRGIYQMALTWVESDGKRGRKSLSTGLPVKGNKKRAEEMLRQTRKEQEKALMQSIDGTVDPKDVLFADFMEIWLEVVKPDIKLTTFGGYHLNVYKAISPYFREKGILLKDLTASDINGFYQEQLKRVKATSVHKFHANISKALKYAVKKELIPYSIMDRVERPKKQRFVGKFLKQSEAVALFEAAKGHKLELGIIFGAFYGLRRGEIIGLKWDAIDFEANTISIEHTVTTATIDGKKILVIDDTTKTKSSYRTLPLVPEIRERLLEIKKEQARCKKACGRSYNRVEGRYIYVNQLGNRINPDYLSSAFPVFLEQHGFRKMRFHDLRHSCASLLLANGVPLKQISDWLGHSNIAITGDTYAHLEYKSKVAAANAMTWINQTTLSSPQGVQGRTSPKKSDSAENAQEKTIGLS